MCTPCEIAGVHFEHNVWNAPVPTSSDDLKIIAESTAGAISIKTHTLQKKIGNPDCYALYPWGAWNNIALHNNGIVELVKHLNSTRYNKPLFISIYGNQDELIDIIRCLDKCKTQDKILIEINLSCPNAEMHYFDENVMCLLKWVSRFPIGVKINTSQNFFFGKPSFITLINSVDSTSGLCIREKAYAHLLKIKGMYPDIPIIACGGIDCLADQQRFLDAGATAIEIGTGYLRWGSQVFMTQQQLLHNFVRRDGSWILSNGSTSDIYIDFRSAPSHPYQWHQLLELSIAKLKDLKFDYICGVPYGAIPLATALAQRLGKPLLIVRKKAKAYGICQIIEGEFVEGKMCLLVEDVVTTGKSIDNTKNILEENKLSVNTFCLFNRSDTNRLSLFDFTDIDITPTKRLQDIIKQKQTKLVFAADIEDSEKLLTILEDIGPYICMVKLHLDIISIPDKARFYKKIQQLSHLHNFLIMDDRKYVDIGSIAHKQILHSQTIVPIHFITVHAAAGSRILDVVPNNIDVFLVTDMSQEGSQECKRFEHKKIVGVVSQGEPVPDLMLMVPGISLTTNQDKHGQQYRKPDQIKADLYVVGRNIYEAYDKNEHISIAKKLRDTIIEQSSS